MLMYIWFKKSSDITESIKEYNLSTTETEKDNVRKNSIILDGLKITDANEILFFELNTGLNVLHLY